MKTKNQIISKSDIKIIRNQAHDYEYKNMKFRLENDSIFKFCADQNGYVFFAKLNGRRGSETIAFSSVIDKHQSNIIKGVK